MPRPRKGSADESAQSKTSRLVNRRYGAREILTEAIDYALNRTLA
jgi:hypothetical protein